MANVTDLVNINNTASIDASTSLARDQLKKINNIKKELSNRKTTKDLLYAAGLYSRSELETGRYYRFNRSGYLDPYNTVSSSNLKEYLFFVKPDLHIIDAKTKKLSKALRNYAFFKDLKNKYPKVITQLQSSAEKHRSRYPFCNLLSFMVNSPLDLPGISSSNIDNPSTIFGNSYEYRGSGEASDDNPKFSLEFKDTRYLDVYMFFKAYEEYEILKRHGIVKPTNSGYTVKKVLHDQMGIYKFIVDDTQTIIHYSYICGVKPEGVPRDSFSNISNFDSGINYSIDFTGAFIEDMNPLILRDFNYLTDPMYKYALKRNRNIPMTTSAGLGNGEFAKTAHIVAYKDSKNKRKLYRLCWAGKLAE